MDTIITSPVKFFNIFIQKFSNFTNKQRMNLMTLMLSLFLEHKRVSVEALAEKCGLKYDQAIYFLTKSKWRPLEQLNKIKFDFICSHKNTAPKKGGVNVIDDTGCPKPHAKNTEGVARQYCGATGREEKCLVAVCAAYVDKNKHLPILLEPYLTADNFELGDKDPKFKSKIDIAIEFIKKLHKDPRFPKIDIVDAWYTCADIIELEDALGRIFIGDLPANRTFRFYHPENKRYEYVNQDKLVKLVRKYYSHKLKPLKRKSKNGKTRTVWTYDFETKLNACKTKIKAVLVIGELFEDDNRSVRILVTNKISMTARQIIETFDLRWGVEVCFRQLKETFYFDHFQMRKLKNIERYWFLVMMAWTITYCCKQRGILSKTIVVEGNNIAAYAKAIRKLLEFEKGRKLSKNKKDVEHYGIISKRAETRAA